MNAECLLKDGRCGHVLNACADTVEVSDMRGAPVGPRADSIGLVGVSWGKRVFCTSG